MADAIDYSRYYDAAYFEGRKTYRHPDGSEHVYHGPSLTWDGFDLVADAIGAIIGNPVADQSLLDIGCSAGDLAQRMARWRFEPYGVEVSRYAAENCVPRMRGRIALADITTCPPELRPFAYGDAAFPAEYDAVLATDLMEHLYAEDLERTFDWMITKTRRWMFLCIATAQHPMSPLAADDKLEFVARKGEPIPIEFEATAASGHVHVRHFSFWQDLFVRKGLTIRWDLMYRFQIARELHPAWRTTGGWNLANTWFLERA